MPVDLSENLGRLDIAVQELLDFRSNEGKKLWLLHHATTDNDTFGRERANKIDQRERKVMRLQIPSEVIGSEHLRRVAQTLSERRFRRQSFQATAVVGTVAPEGIALPVVRDTRVSYLGMNEPWRHRSYATPPPPIPVPTVM